MRYTLIIFALSLCTSFTQEVVKEGLLDPITITATRFNELVSNVAYSVDLIEDRDILEDMPRASIENITDQEYRVHGSGQNETGLNFIFGASLKF